MAEKTMKEIFETLSKVDMTPFLKEEGELSYIPWAVEWRELLKLFPNSDWRPIKSPEGRLYHTDGASCWVEVEVDIEGVKRCEELPVLTLDNEVVYLNQINSALANASLRRCLVKCIATKFGLGIEVYCGNHVAGASDDAKIADGEVPSPEVSSTAPVVFNPETISLNDVKEVLKTPFPFKFVDFKGEPTANVLLSVIPFEGDTKSTLDAKGKQQDDMFAGANYIINKGFKPTVNCSLGIDFKQYVAVLKTLVKEPTRFVEAYNDLATEGGTNED